MNSNWKEYFSRKHLQAVLYHNLQIAKTYLVVFFKWTFLAITIGVISGFVGTAFHFTIEKATEFHKLYPQTLYLLPLLGVILVFLYRVCNQINDRGTNQVIDAVTKPEKVTPQLAPLIFIASALTHLGGGSAGREGAALQIGGSMAATLGKAIRLRERDLKVLTMCGMSAVFSALFGTPLTAAVFSLEVISIGIMYYSALYPCLLAAITAYIITGRLGIETGHAMMTFSFPFEHMTLVQIALLAALAALVSIVFCIVTGRAHLWFHKYIKNDYLRILVGAAFIILLTLLFGTTIYNGVGMDVIQNMLAGNTASWEMWICKLLLTAVTIGCGFRGGEIVPCMFVGATFGSFVSPFIGLDPGLGAAIGLITVFCGCVNCPIASTFLAIELFGGTQILYFAVACAIGYTLSGYFGVYTSQHFNYSKTQAMYLKDRPSAKH